jgi:hypothetical protein
MSEQKKVRRMHLELNWAEVKCSWGGSKLIVRGGDYEHPTEVVLAIKQPYELAYLREQLDKIEAGWAKDLERAKP